MSEGDILCYCCMGCGSCNKRKPTREQPVSLPLNQLRPEQYNNQNAGMHYPGRSDAAANNVSAANAPVETSKSGPGNSGEEKAPPLPPRHANASSRETRKSPVANSEALQFDDPNSVLTSSVGGSLGPGSSDHYTVLSAHHTGSSVRDDWGYSGTS